MIHGDIKVNVKRALRAILKNAEGVNKPVRRTQLPFLIFSFSFLIFHLQSLSLDLPFLLSLNMKRARVPQH
jgi:hypothetical protein